MFKLILNHVYLFFMPIYLFQVIFLTNLCLDLKNTLIVNE